MPSFPPRNSATKKRQILERRIFEFLQLRNTDKKSEKQLRLADKVKVAKLNHLKARLAVLKTYASEVNFNTNLEDKILQEINEWENISYEDIISFCLMHSR